MLPVPGSALRTALREGYSAAQLRRDAAAGVVVGIVALPLSMALAIACGVAPQHGLYTAIVAGGLIALLGGSRTQVSGPTAAFVAILAPITAEFGLGGLLLATAMAGVLLITMAVARLGRVVQLLPYPVITGFTAGIAVVLAVGQLPDLLGLSLLHLPPEFTARVGAIGSSLGTMRLHEVGLAALTLLLLAVAPRLTHRLPAPLIALTTAGIMGWLLERFTALPVATIAGRFSTVVDGTVVHGIPALPPLWTWPWEMPGPNGAPVGISLDLLRALMPAAVAIAMLGAIESLLAAVAADAMAGTRHDPDAELLAQGVGNLVAPFFGGFAATGAIARTATNVRAGARSPLASVVHAGFLLATVLLLAPLLGHLPMAAMAALLIFVAWRMADARHAAYVLRTAPGSDRAVLLTCFVLTVVFDMVVAVVAGIVLASLLFMRRMHELSGAELIAPDHPRLPSEPPPGVLVYDVAGPLFFGAAQKALRALESIGDEARVVVLDLGGVPSVDATGIVNLHSALDRLLRRHVTVVLCAVRPAPTRDLARANIRDDGSHLRMVPSLAEALRVAAAAAHPSQAGGTTTAGPA